VICFVELLGYFFGRRVANGPADTTLNRRPCEKSLQKHPLPPKAETLKPAFLTD